MSSEKKSINFESVLKRLKKALNLKRDYEVADLINFKHDNFNARKKKDSIPFKEFINLANSKNISLDWLMNGIGEMTIDENSQTENTYSKDIKNLRHKITLLKDDEIKALSYIINQLLKKG